MGRWCAVSDPFGDLDETLDETDDRSSSDEDSIDDTDRRDVDNTDSADNAETVSKRDSADNTNKTSDTERREDSRTETATSRSTETATTNKTSGDRETRVASDEQGADAGSTGEESATDDGTLSPAFPFAEADQTAVYPRAGTWAAFEDFLDFEVRRRLREAGVRNDTKRELHEAALQVIRDHPDAVAERFLNNRRESDDNETGD